MSAATAENPESALHTLGAQDSFVSRTEAAHLVTAMIGRADYLDEHSDTVPDAAHRSLRTTVLAAKLQAGFTLSAEQLSIEEMTSIDFISAIDHNLISTAIEHALLHETDEQVISVLSAISTVLDAQMWIIV